MGPYSTKIRTMVEAHVNVAYGHPVLFSIYLVVFAGFVLATLWLISRQQAKTGLWCLVGAILTDFIFSRGDDIFSHVHRIAALADQVRQGSFSALITDPLTGTALPTFVYYSEIPYYFPVLLDLLGVPALYGFKFTMCLLFVVLAAGLHTLLLRTASPSAPRERLQSDFFVAFLFLAANYVYALWFARGSLAEVWVYCLMPWVVVATLSPRSGHWLAVFLFLQICGHPIVLGQSLLAEVLVAYCLTGLTFVGLIRRGLVPFLVALLLATPFWLPQALWQDVILGPSALPANFFDSFFRLDELISFRQKRTVGIWLPLAVLLVIFTARARLPRTFWIPIAVAVVITALETIPLFDVTRHIPTLDLSLFIWRLALPVAFLLFGGLLVGWRHMVQPPRRRLTALAALATLGMTFLMLEIEPGFPAVLDFGWQQDRRALSDDPNDNAVWGVREYHPNYAKLPQNCDAAGAARATYREVRAGYKTDAAAVLVRRGPVGLVDYEANGAPVRLAACKEDLVLGPLPAGATVTVSELRMNRLKLLRTVGFFLALALMIWVMPFRRLSLEPAGQLRGI